MNRDSILAEHLRALCQPQPPEDTKEDPNSIVIRFVRALDSHENAFWALDSDSEADLHAWIVAGDDIQRDLARQDPLTQGWVLRHVDRDVVNRMALDSLLRFYEDGDP